jgi:hypothetical protein
MLFPIDGNTRALLAFDLGLFRGQLLGVLKDGSSWVPANLKESRVFP